MGLPYRLILFPPKVCLHTHYYLNVFIFERICLLVVVFIFYQSLKVFTSKNWYFNSLIIKNTSLLFAQTHSLPLKSSVNSFDIYFLISQQHLCIATSPLFIVKHCLLTSYWGIAFLSCCLAPYTFCSHHYRLSGVLILNPDFYNQKQTLCALNYSIMLYLFVPGSDISK